MPADKPHLQISPHFESRREKQQQQQQQQLYYQKIYTMFWKKNIYIIKTEYGNNSQKN